MTLPDRSLCTRGAGLVTFVVVAFLSACGGGGGDSGAGPRTTGALSVSACVIAEG